MSTKSLKLYVYFVQADFTGLIKIGKSVHPSLRLQGLQAENADNLKLIGLMRAQHERTEALLHNQFKKWRLHGEWFQPATEIFNYISAHSDSALVKACLAKVKLEELFPPVTQKCLNCGDAAHNNQYCGHTCRLADWAEEHGEAYWNKLSG